MASSGGGVFFICRYLKGCYDPRQWFGERVEEEGKTEHS
jgi:hypothetical protein